MLLPILFLSTICNIANATSSDLTVTVDTEMANHSRPTNSVTINLGTVANDQVIPDQNGPSLKVKTITALPFIITAIGACIHITAILTYGFDDKAKLLVAGDIFWLSSAITGIAIKFSGY